MKCVTQRVILGNFRPLPSPHPCQAAPVSHCLVSAEANGAALALHSADGWGCHLALIVHPWKISAGGSWGDADGEGNGSCDTASGKGHAECSVPLLAMLVLGGWAGTGHQAPSEAEVCMYNVLGLHSVHV